MGDQFLYDNSGNRVLQRATVTASGSTSATDTIYFDGYTETAIDGSNTSTIKYYSANGQKLAMNQQGTLTYLVSDLLGNSTLTLKSDGTLYSAQLFNPFGSVRYNDSTMPNSFSFTGQRLDSQTGLLYYNFRYYDPVSGRFTRTDTQETNAAGMDTYGYVHGNPETMCDPTGHRYTDENGDVGYVYKVNNQVEVATYTEQTQTYTDYFPSYHYTYSYKSTYHPQVRTSPRIPSRKENMKRPLGEGEPAHTLRHSRPLGDSETFHGFRHLRPFGDSEPVHNTSPNTYDCKIKGLELQERDYVWGKDLYLNGNSTNLLSGVIEGAAWFCGPVAGPAVGLIGIVPLAINSLDNNQGMHIVELPGPYILMLPTF
jgi:RHS repeat-associated protein